MYRRSPLRSTLRIVCSTGLPTCLPIYSTGVLFGMMPCLADWLGSAGSFYLKPPTGNLGTRTAIRTTVRPQLAHGRDSQSRPNLSREPLGTISATGSPSKIQATGCARQRATVEPCTAVVLLVFVLWSLLLILSDSIGTSVSPDSSSHYEINSSRRR